MTFQTRTAHLNIILIVKNDEIMNDRTNYLTKDQFYQLFILNLFQLYFWLKRFPKNFWKNKTTKSKTTFAAPKHNRLMIQKYTQYLFCSRFSRISSPKLVLTFDEILQYPYHRSFHHTKLKMIAIIIRNSHFAKSIRSIRKLLAYDESSRCLIGRGNNRVIIGSFLSREDKE